MAFFDKLNQVAKNIGDKTSDAIETTKLNSKIASEKLAANEELLKIGQFYYDRFLMGQAEPDIVGYCQAAKSHLDAAAQAQADIDRIKMDNGAPAAYGAQPAYNAQPEPAPAAGGAGCPNCGTVNPEGTKFCAGCGTKLEAPAQPQGIFCPNCGASLLAGTKFCNQCGNRMDG